MAMIGCPSISCNTTYRGAARDALPTLYKWQDPSPSLPPTVRSMAVVRDRLANIINHIASTIAAIENDTNPPALTYFKSLTASANPPVVTLPTTSTVLTPVLTDLDGGTPELYLEQGERGGNCLVQSKRHDRQCHLHRHVQHARNLCPAGHGGGSLHPRLQHVDHLFPRLFRLPDL